MVAGRQSPPDISIAGARSDQKLAATITPAASPSIPSMIFWLKRLVKNTGTAPAAVRSHVKSVATSAIKMGCHEEKNSNRRCSTVDPCQRR